MVLIVAALWLGKPLLMPIALGVVVAFALLPLARTLERLWLPRAVAVAFTIALALAAVGGFGVVLVNQVDSLSEELSHYTSKMRRKVRELRTGSSSALDKIEDTVNKVSEVLDEEAKKNANATRVRVVPDPLSPSQRIRTALEPLFEPLASVVLVLVLVIYMLGSREDLRNRILRLAGREQLTVTTRMMDEALSRVSRYLFAQTLINVCFGALIGGGLYWIGVPYALLWGVITAVLRFVPYVGSLMAGAMASAMAFAVFPGWTETLETISLYVGLDITVGYFVEPLVIGRRTGVSSLALLISAIFWTWIWGPAGLVLATPMTVCVAVLGREVPQLEFLAVLLSDEPALEPEVVYYQRLLARDEDEASDIFERERREIGSTAALDQLVLPSLVLAANACDRDQISEEDFAFVLATAAETMQHLPAEKDASTTLRERPRIALACSTGTRANAILLNGLAYVLSAYGYQLKTMGAEELGAASQAPELACLVAFPASAGAESRALCRAFRSAFPETPLLVLRPGLAGHEAGRAIARLREAGATEVSVGLAEVGRWCERTRAAA
jgi:predicted PurR-regulated permease PerM